MLCTPAHTIETCAELAPGHVSRHHFSTCNLLTCYSVYPAQFYSSTPDPSTRVMRQTVDLRRLSDLRCAGSVELEVGRVGMGREFIALRRGRAFDILVAESSITNGTCRRTTAEETPRFPRRGSDCRSHEIAEGKVSGEWCSAVPIGIDGPDGTPAAQGTRHQCEDERPGASVNEQSDSLLGEERTQQKPPGMWHPLH